MFKFLSKFLIFFLLLLITTSLFLSYFGLETEKFNNLIKEKANAINQYVKIDFEKTKIYLNTSEFNLLIKLTNPKILVKKNEINLSKVNLFLPIKSFFNSDFLLERTEIAFANNDIRDISKVTKIFLPNIINKQLNKIFKSGKLDGEFVIPFEPNGSLAKNYAFTGKVIDAKVNFTKNIAINNFTSEITHYKDFDIDIFKLNVKKGFIFDLNLDDSEINIERGKNSTNINSTIKTKGNINSEKIKKISSLLNFEINSFKNINGKIDLHTNINFILDNYFRMKNLSYLTQGSIPVLQLDFNDKINIKKYFPEYESKLKFKKIKIKFENSEQNNLLNIEGLTSIKDSFSNFEIKKTYNHSNKKSNLSGFIDLTKIRLKIPEFNFTKEADKKSLINLDLIFSLNNYFDIKKLRLISENNKIILSDLNLNKEFQVVDFKRIEVKTHLKKDINNDFIITKNKEIVAEGNIFDAEPLLKSLYKNNKKKTFSKKFSSKIKINFDNVITGTNDDVSSFAIIGSIINGSFEKLSLKGNFSNNEILEISIYKISNDKKTLHVISDRARPFVKNFNFIKGFEGGKLEYESVISKKITNSNLLITDFNVSEVPALAKLLTLASLQGIADTLNGEGISFDTFEMKSNSVGNVLKIEDALAMGPAVSIILDGYVEKNKIVSLRGTLVPATKINAIIAKIPLVGDILVGKKTGEGVVGVSFKMKGPPEDIKTTVNPIKTITPRFIVRAVEKMKREKKNKTK